MSTINNGNSPSTLTLDIITVRAFIVSLFIRVGVPADRASLVAEALITADMRGVSTHGITRLSIYIQRIQAGVVDPNPELEFDQVTPVMASLDGKNTLGFVVGSLAIDHAVSIAEIYGVGIVSAKHSNHFGMAANYLLRAINKGFAAFVFTNASKSMPPWGGKEALLGTSPFAAGFPGGKEGPFILDMSPSVAARGKMRLASKKGEKIPLGYALDAEGKPTTDPAAALKGVVLPIGGPKGSGIAMLMDIFGGIISGSAFCGDVNDQYNVMDRPQNVGHWFMVFKPEVFLGSKEKYYERMDESMRRVRAVEKAEGVKRIYTAGEIEQEMFAKASTEGITISSAEIEALNKLAAEVGSDKRL